MNEHRNCVRALEELERKRQRLEADRYKLMAALNKCCVALADFDTEESIEAHDEACDVLLAVASS